MASAGLPPKLLVAPGANEPDVTGVQPGPRDTAAVFAATPAQALQAPTGPSTGGTGTASLHEAAWRDDGNHAPFRMIALIWPRLSPAR